MLEPLHPLPTTAEDPRLDDWYQTIELAPGIASRGFFRHTPAFASQVGMPESLAGKTALDVGTANGYWAFEMERRGADRVSAIDIRRYGDYDMVPGHRSAQGVEVLNHSMNPRFATAHAMRRSRVEFKFCSVYDLSPEQVGGTFDLVYCGSLLLHLFNPLQALINIRSVTRGMAIIETATNPEMEAVLPGVSYATFGAPGEEKHPGEHVTYWILGPQTLCKMLRYAGFSRVESRGIFKMDQAPPPGFLWVTAAVAYV